MPKKYSDKVKREAVRLSRTGIGTGDIVDRVSQMKGAESVDVRTVQRWLEPYRKEEPPSPPWTLAGALGDEAQFVLPVLAEVLRQSGPPGPPVTVRQAEWIARIGRAVPDLPPWELYNYALEYIRCENEKRSAEHVDASLAYRPWEGAGRARAFQEDAKRWGLSEVILFGAPNEIIDEALGEFFSEAQAALPKEKSGKRRRKR